MANLMVSVSGVRGIVGDGLTSQNVMQFAQAFGNYLGNGEVVVGRDSRVTGTMFKHAVFAGLMAAGCDIIDIGMCSTPTAQMAVEKLKARGGIVITASHNPIQWNALKLLDSTGMFLDETQGNKVIKIVEDGDFQNVQWDQVGKIESYENATEDHLKAILKLDMISPDQITKKKFKVVIDCVNGAGGIILPSLMQKLGCNTVFMNEETTGLFPRSPEPLPENLKQLCERVVSEKADIGFAVDPDVDRLAIVSEKGKPLGEEYTLVLAIKYMLKKMDGPIVVNASVTQAVDDLAKKYNTEVIRTKVGEIHVAKKMKQVRAVIGGEGNGGVILPELHLGRDAPLGIALILQQLAEYKGTISELHQFLPQYFQSKNRIEINDMDVSSIMDFIVKKHKKENIDKTDGVKFLWKDHWVHIRPSNTEPIIRIYSEARSAEEADALGFKFINEIQEFKNL